jgi:hypothetical protein
MPRASDNAADRAAASGSALWSSTSVQRRATWVGWAAAAWSGAYGALGVHWAMGGAAFPFGSVSDPQAAGQSILEHADQAATAPVIAVLGLSTAAGAAVVLARRPRSAAHRLLVGLGWVLAVALTLVIPDGRLLIAAAHVPIVLVGLPFGWPPGVSLSSQLPWPVINQFILVTGGLLWAATALILQRRLRTACEYCGRSDRTGRWSSPECAARWGRWMTYIAVAVPLVYAATRFAWALGIPLGVSRQFLREQAADSPDIWLAGAFMATLAVGGAVLTLGLVQRWGEVYPRWIPGLRGRPVRPRTAIVPATLVAVFIFNAALSGLRAFVLGNLPQGAVGEDWGTVGPGLLWPLWSVALGAATLAYHLRRRGRCGRCGRL